MSEFARLQDAFQRAVLAGDDAVLADLLDGARDSKETLLGIYRDGYVLRLVEVLRGDHPALEAHLGEEGFEAMARGYLAAHPSRHPNARQVGRALAAYLGETEPYRGAPVLTELAALEWALSEAFDAPDAAELSAADLARVPPERWRDLVLLPQPHARRLDLATNACAIWVAANAAEPAPEAARLPEPERILIWRADATPTLRPLSIEEAMLWDEASAGLPFGVLCEMAATYADPDDAALRVAGLLQGWIAAGLLAGFRLEQREEPSADPAPARFP